jgi:hypothetical protein
MGDAKSWKSTYRMLFHVITLDKKSRFFLSLAKEVSASALSDFFIAGSGVSIADTVHKLSECHTHALHPFENPTTLDI